MAIIIEQFLKRNPYVLIFSISVSIPIIGGILYSLSISGSDFWIRPVYVIYISNLFELIILTYGLTIRYNKFKKVNSVLVLNLAKLKNEVSEKIIQTQETERRRLAQDLHDDLGGTLSAIKGRLSNETVHLETIHLVEKAIEDLRLVSRNLMPPELANEGLVKAISHTIERLQNTFQIEFTYISFGNEVRLSEEKELNIYRIVAELLNNVVKHSKATKAIIQLIYYEKYLLISFEDNGIGINTNENSWGIGLKNINSRVEFMKAKIITDSNATGTTFMIEVLYN